MDKNFWREYFSIPNIMGYFRIALAMLYMLLFYRALDGAPYWPVIVTIVISGITDFFDGKIARRFNMITDWGKMLDPIADKITLGAIIISMSFKYSIVVFMVVFYIIKWKVIWRLQELYQLEPDTKSKVQCGMAKYALCNLCNSDCIAFIS